jgi:hypothetical protein
MTVLTREEEDAVIAQADGIKQRRSEALAQGATTRPA